MAWATVVVAVGTGAGAWAQTMVTDTPGSIEGRVGDVTGRWATVAGIVAGGPFASAWWAERGAGAQRLVDVVIFARPRGSTTLERSGAVCIDLVFTGTDGDAELIASSIVYYPREPGVTMFPDGAYRFTAHLEAVDHRATLDPLGVEAEHAPGPVPRARSLLLSVRGRIDGTMRHRDDLAGRMSGPDVPFDLEVDVAVPLWPHRVLPYVPESVRPVLHGPPPGDDGAWYWVDHCLGGGRVREP
jgi:hypothetical protein